MTKHDTEMRSRLLQAARKIFAAKGYHAARVDEIIKEAKASKGAFYWHFPDKLSIFREVSLERIRVLREQWAGSSESFPIDFASYALERGDSDLVRCCRDPDSVRLWLHHITEASCGNEELASLVRNRDNSSKDFLLPLLRETYPKEAARISDGMNFEELVLLLAMCFEGILIRFVIDGDETFARRAWAFLVHRIAGKDDTRDT